MIDNVYRVLTMRVNKISPLILPAGRSVDWNCEKFFVKMPVQIKRKIIQFKFTKLEYQNERFENI